MMGKTVMVSGGFDPIHPGHIKMISDASEYGDVIIVANSDSWLIRKKGYYFMPFSARREILKSIKGVTYVYMADDEDNTVIESLKKIRPTYFANGGDRGKTNTPEQEICDELGIEMLWGIGGTDKIWSSSSIVNRVMNFHPLLPGTAE